MFIILNTVQGMEMTIHSAQIGSYTHAKHTLPSGLGVDGSALQLVGTSQLLSVVETKEAIDLALNAVRAQALEKKKEVFESVVSPPSVNQTIPATHPTRGVGTTTSNVGIGTTSGKLSQPMADQLLKQQIATKHLTEKKV